MVADPFERGQSWNLVHTRIPGTEAPSIGLGYPGKNIHVIGGLGRVTANL
jgi:hypothetical protein